MNNQEREEEVIGAIVHLISRRDCPAVPLVNGHRSESSNPAVLFIEIQQEAAGEQGENQPKTMREETMNNEPKKTCEICGCFNKTEQLCARDKETDFLSGGDGEMPLVACVDPRTCWQFYVPGRYLHGAFINGYSSFN